MRLIEQVWFDEHPVNLIIVPLLLPLTFVFWLLSTARRWCFKIGLYKSVKLAKPVIVVGNISVGGNGKTPIVLWLIDRCRTLGLDVGVISRGYGGKSAHYPLLLNKNTTTAQAGDEPIMIYQRTGVAVAVGPDRVASAKALIAQGCDIIISDDGLQHYRLGRALELTVIDGKRGFGNGLLMPAGPLREGLWRLKTVDHIIVNGVATINLLPVPDPLMMSLKPQKVINMVSDEQLNINDFAQHYQSGVNAIAGIGAPQRFFDTLIAHKIKLVHQQAFADHYPFKKLDLAHFSDDLPLIMTEKDAVKCKGFAKKNWWFLAVEAQFNEKAIAPLLEQISALTQQ